MVVSYKFQAAERRGALKGTNKGQRKAGVLQKGELLGGGRG
mgnify:CR=1 FL=1